MHPIATESSGVIFHGIALGAWRMRRVLTITRATTTAAKDQRTRAGVGTVRSIGMRTLQRNMARPKSVHATEEIPASVNLASPPDAASWKQRIASGARIVT